MAIGDGIRRNVATISQEERYSSPFAQSISNFLNFKLSVESSTQPLPLQDFLLQL